MTYPRNDDDVIALDGEEWDDEEDDDDAIDLGPDERDRDLLDGSWERDYYAGRVRTFDWRAIYTALALLILMGMLIPVILAVFD